MGRGERREVTRYQSFQPLSCLVTTGTIRPDNTLHSPGIINTGISRTNRLLVSGSVDQFGKFGKSFNLVCKGFLPPFFVLCIELVLGPLFSSEFICFPTNMCISGALKLSLQTMPPYPAWQPRGGVISALMCPGLG